MAYSNVPVNGWPQIKDLERLDALAKQIEDMPVYTSDDRAFLDTWERDLPILEQDVSDLETTKANQITIAPTFSAETAYDVGDLVYYNGLSYRCTNAHEGEWDADDFAATTINNELATLNSNLSNKATFATYTISGSETVNIYHSDGILLFSDRGGLYGEGVANRGTQGFSTEGSITVTHVDGNNVTVQNTSTYGTTIMIFSGGNITVTQVNS